MAHQKNAEKVTMTRAVFSVRGIECATCSLAIEKRLKRLEGVKGVRAAIMLNKVFVDYDESKTNLPEIMEAIEKTGYANYLSRDSDRPNQKRFSIRKPTRGSPP